MGYRWKGIMGLLSGKLTVTMNRLLGFYWI